MMFVEGDDDAVVIAAINVLKKFLGSEPIRIRLGILGAFGAANDMHHGFAEFITNGFEFGPVVGKQTVIDWQLLPPLNVYSTEICFVNDVSLEIIMIPRFSAGCAIHIHENIGSNVLVQEIVEVILTQMLGL